MRSGGAGLDMGGWTGAKRRLLRSLDMASAGMESVWMLGVGGAASRSALAASARGSSDNMSPLFPRGGGRVLVAWFVTEGVGLLRFLLDFLASLARAAGPLWVVTRARVVDLVGASLEASLTSSEDIVRLGGAVVGHAVGVGLFKTHFLGGPSLFWVYGSGVGFGNIHLLASFIGIVSARCGR